MMSKEEKSIVEKLKNCLGYDAPKISQDQFDNIVRYIMKYETVGGNPKELVWRLCGCYKGFNFNNVIDIYVDTRDAYYISELVTFVGGNLNQEYLAKKMIETEDLEFIDKAMTNCDNAMIYYLNEEVFEKIKTYYDNKTAK